MSKVSGKEIASRQGALVIRGDKTYKRSSFNPLNWFSNIVIWSLIIPVTITDLWLGFYQFIYFGVHAIPKISRSEYVVVDRHHLKKLTFWQKLNCAYCGYANGVINWAKAIAAQTEIYSCAIKHWHPAKGQEGHEKGYYSYRTFN